MATLRTGCYCYLKLDLLSFQLPDSSGRDSQRNQISKYFLSVPKGYPVGLGIYTQCLQEYDYTLVFNAPTKVLLINRQCLERIIWQSLLDE